LQSVPDEFVDVIKQIAQSLGEILGIDKRNSYSEDQRFCIALLSGMPYEIVKGIVNPVIGRRTEIVVDYNNLPIRCRYYMAIDHLIKDCPGLNEGKSKDQTEEVDKSQSIAQVSDVQSKTGDASSGLAKQGSGSTGGRQGQEPQFHGHPLVGKVLAVLLSLEGQRIEMRKRNEGPLRSKEYKRPKEAVRQRVLKKELTSLQREMVQSQVMSLEMCKRRELSEGQGEAMSMSRHEECTHRDIRTRPQNTMIMMTMSITWTRE
jgi:hypothetical protein